MKLKTILYTTLFLTSCAKTETAVIEYQLPKSVKTDAIPLKVDTIKLKEEHIHASKYFLHNDTLLIVTNRQNSNNVPLLQVYNFPEQKPISGFINFGKGPNEVVWALVFNNNGDNLNVQAASNRGSAFIPLDSLLNPNYKPKIHKYNITFQNSNQYDQNQMIIENPYCFADQESGIVNVADRFVIVDNDFNGQTNEDIFGKHQYSTINLVGGGILVNKDKNRVIYAPYHESLIEFYDYDLKLIKKLFTPDSFKTEYVLFGEQVMAKSGITSIFKASYKTDDYVYLCYNGALVSEGGDKDLDTWIFQFDWDGNFIKSYFCDRYISALSKSKDDGVFYATVLDDSDMEVFVKLYVQ